LTDRIRNEDLRKRLGTDAAIDYIKRQQIKWFGHVLLQRELNMKQRVIIKKDENTRQSRRPGKRCISGILCETSQLKRPTEELIAANCLSPQR
jgi:hypothetical protein